MFYTQLVNFESDKYHVQVAKTSKEKCELIEAGFQHVATDPSGTMYFRKRKWPCGNFSQLCRNIKNS